MSANASYRSWNAKGKTSGSCETLSGSCRLENRYAAGHQMHANSLKTYPGKPPVEAVRGIDLEVQEGECFGVLGPNGAGKTTTIEILEGLLSPTSGDVEVLATRWNDDPDAIRQRIGISLQETQFSDKLTVWETLTAVPQLLSARPGSSRGDRTGFAGGESGNLGEEAFRRTAAAAGRRHSRDRRSSTTVPRRTDHRPRSSVTASVVGRHS